MYNLRSPPYAGFGKLKKKKNRHYSVKTKQKKFIYQLNQNLEFDCLRVLSIDYNYRYRTIIFLPTRWNYGKRNNYRLIQSDRILTRSKIQLISKRYQESSIRFCPVILIYRPPCPGGQSRNAPPPPALFHDDVCFFVIDLQNYYYIKKIHKIFSHNTALFYRPQQEKKNEDDITLIVILLYTFTLETQYRVTINYPT